MIEKIITETDHRNNPYFLSLQDGTFSKEDFVETQLQFYYAVIFFSRPMAALAAKIPSAELRLEILRNVWEEHGEGHLSQGHGNTFIEFLRRLDGKSQADLEARTLWPEIRIFNATLAGTAALDDYLVGVAAIGIIEKMFSDISFLIGQAIISRHWLTPQQLIHYKLHQTLDIKHSDDFFAILKEPFKASVENKYSIEQGLYLGATLFNDLYLGLWKSRQRRWILSHAHPN